MPHNLSQEEAISSYVCELKENLAMHISITGSGLQATMDKNVFKNECLDMWYFYFNQVFGMYYLKL